MGLLVQLDPIDNVAIATAPITPGQSVQIGNRSITAQRKRRQGPQNRDQADSPGRSGDQIWPTDWSSHGGSFRR